jgi:Flp pilus assembly protein TadG
MSNRRIAIRRRPEERGQTIVLVAIALVSLLGMAALAIDVTTLYVARGEMQRAADAAALAGAKAFVDSGITTDTANATRQALAQTMATSVINSILAQNKISGAPPVLAAAPAFDFTRPGNPQISVTLQRTNLPTFFARIWGTKLVTVTASAIAEAYNASSSQNSTGNYVPVTPKCVKPLLVPNLDPNRGGAPYIPIVATGAVAPGLVGEGPFTLSNGCPNGAALCRAVPAPAANNYFPAAAAANPDNLCPSCVGASVYEQSIECCDIKPYSCGGTAAIPPPSVDGTMGGNTSRQDTHNGVQCLIHSPGEDTIVVDDLVAGTGPAKITAGSGPQSGNLVTTSSSIATLPIFDVASLNPGTGDVTIVGFMQVFIAGAAGNGDLTVAIVNVVGCGNNPSGGAPVSGGGMSPIPVRLIH